MHRLALLASFCAAYKSRRSCSTVAVREPRSGLTWWSHKHSLSAVSYRGGADRGRRRRVGGGPGGGKRASQAVRDHHHGIRAGGCGALPRRPQAHRGADSTACLKSSTKILVEVACISPIPLDTSQAFKSCHLNPCRPLRKWYGPYKSSICKTRICVRCGHCLWSSSLACRLRPCSRAHPACRRALRPAKEAAARPHAAARVDR